MVVHSKWSFKRSGRLYKFDCIDIPQVVWPLKGATGMIELKVWLLSYTWV